MPNEKYTEPGACEGCGRVLNAKDRPICGDCQEKPPEPQEEPKEPAS